MERTKKQYQRPRWAQVSGQGSGPVVLRLLGYTRVPRGVAAMRSSRRKAVVDG